MSALFIFTLGKHFFNGYIYFRYKGVKVHAANSAAVIKGYATDLDFVRPGIAMYGLAPGNIAFHLHVVFHIFTFLHNFLKIIYLDF